MDVALPRLLALRGPVLRQEPLPERPLVAAAVAAVAGAAVASAVAVSPAGCWCMAVGGVVAWRVTFLRGATRLAGGLLLLAIAAAAAGWYASRVRLFPADELAWRLSTVPQPVAIEGTVREPPRALPLASDPLRQGPAGAERPSSEFVLEVERTRCGDQWRAAAGRATVVVDGVSPAVSVGTRVRVFGRGLRPAAPLNPGEFDFRERARLVRCLSVVRAHDATCVEPLGEPGVWTPRAWIDHLRSRGVDVFRRHISPERAALAAALLLGGRESLARDATAGFLVTGTVHVLSISGLHVGFIALALVKLLRLAALPRAAMIAAIVGCTGIYMLLVGGETPVVRATLLVWLTAVATALGRRAASVTALAFAALVVLVLNPGELTRVGTQLSFLSTAVLIGASTAVHRPGKADPIERLIERSRPPWVRRLRAIVRQSAMVAGIGAAVWLVTAPVVASRFHLFSPIGLLINPLVAPLVAGAMVWGGLCLAVAPVSTWLAAICGRGCDMTLRSLETVVAAAAAVPGGHVWVPAPAGWWVAGWFGLLAATLLLVSRERLRSIHTWAVVVVVWAVVGVVADAGVWPRDTRCAGMRVLVTAVGHGCGIVVRSPSGRCLVYDAGRLGAGGAAARSLSSVLWGERVRRIDTLVISHADTDHFNAVPDLAARFTIGEIVVPPAFLQARASAPRRLVTLARDAGIPVRAAQAGGGWAVDPLCRVRVLHPFPDAGPAREPVAGAPSDNETSLVLAVETAGRTLLLTGDLEGAALDRFVAAGPERCDVLVAPHHGSLSSLPPTLAVATAAEWVVVSGASSPGWPRVRDAYAAARPGGTAVLKTGSEGVHGGGAVALLLSAEGVDVRQYVLGKWERVARQDAMPGRGPLETVASGRVSSQPAAMMASWLATKPASSNSTPLVKP
jgi:competence protein ComEC